jgi:ABC-type multidrug transport system ATPase subunit
MREPIVLFVDEPTSGLSSFDSEKVMSLLRNQALRGKMVFAIIHQPSSDIIKMFDKLWILDKGGYMIYVVILLSSCYSRRDLQQMLRK